MSRYPLVLSAVVCKPASLLPRPTFGIRPLWSFVRNDIGVDIGPNRGWFAAARENRLLTDEALRVLKSEWPPEQLLDAVLETIPAAERVLITSDSPHIWAFGRHPEAPWTYHVIDAFKLFDTAPRQPTTVVPLAADDRFAELRRFAAANLKGQERAVVEALYTAGGELPIADLAIGPGINWGDPFKGFESVQRRLNAKIKRCGWRLTRHNNAARLANTSTQNPRKTR